MSRRFLPRLRGPPCDQSPLLELDDVVVPEAAHGERHREHITDRTHTLARAPFGQVVVAIPSRLQRWLGDEFEDLVRRRRDLATGADDLGSVAVHSPIQQYLDSDKLRMHSRTWNLSLPKSNTGGHHDRTSRRVCTSRRSRPREDSQSAGPG